MSIKALAMKIIIIKMKKIITQVPNSDSDRKFSNGLYEL
jgi:hypothetical protein